MTPARKGGTEHTARLFSTNVFSCSPTAFNSPLVLKLQPHVLEPFADAEHCAVILGHNFRVRCVRHRPIPLVLETSDVAVGPVGRVCRALGLRCSPGQRDKGGESNHRRPPISAAASSTHRNPLRWRWLLLMLPPLLPWLCDSALCSVGSAGPFEKKHRRPRVFCFSTDGSCLHPTNQLRLLFCSPSDPRRSSTAPSCLCRQLFLGESGVTGGG